MSKSLYTTQHEGASLQHTPTPAAGSPWSAAAQHGGPPCALLAGAVEEAVDDAALRPAYFRAELFRAVPMAPLQVETEVLRRGRRLVSVEARLRSEQVVARASALFLLETESPDGRRSDPQSGADERSGLRAPPGPGADLQPMIPAEHVMRFPPGFHTTVEVETLSSPLQAAWVRIPCDFSPGRELTAFQRAAATSDFCNALRARHTTHQAGFINVDSAVHFLRQSSGEWIGLELTEVLDLGTTGFARCTLFDEKGTFGWVTQNSLGNARA